MAPTYRLHDNIDYAKFMQTDYAMFMQNDSAKVMQNNAKFVQTDYAKLKNTKAKNMQGKGDIHYFLLGSFMGAEELS